MAGLTTPNTEHQKSNNPAVGVTAGSAVTNVGRCQKPLAYWANRAAKVGDWVLATDPETGETTIEPVKDLISGDGVKNLIQVGTDPDGDGEPDWITAPGGHPFWVPECGWTDAQNLRLGDLLMGPDGLLIEITDLDTNTSVATVHNLTVNRIHTYYVLAKDEPLLVHNAKCTKSNGKKKKNDVPSCFKSERKQGNGTTQQALERLFGKDHKGNKGSGSEWSQMKKYLDQR